jgi:hypothetical protein
MDLAEYPLLNRPALMLTVLETARHGAATLGDCRRRLDAALAAARERRPPVEETAILAELDLVRRHLAAALLLEPVDAARFRLTERGAAALAAHRAGIDESVLMEFPEYRAFIARLAADPPEEDPRGRAYDEGWAAFQDGAPLQDNPFAPDAVDHLAWENGWLEARDEADEHARPAGRR